MVQKRISFTVEQIQNFCKYVGRGKEFTSEAEAVRTFVEYGMQLLEYKKIMQDPQKREELIQKMNAKLKDEKVFQWVSTLKEPEMEAIVMAIKLEKDSRFKQSSLL